MGPEVGLCAGRRSLIEFLPKGARRGKDVRRCASLNVQKPALPVAKAVSATVPVDSSRVPASS